MPPRGFLLSLALAIALLPARAEAQQPATCRVGTTGFFQCTPPWAQSWIPSGIPATKIGSGTVNDTVLGYLAGATSPLQPQINALAAAAGSYVTLSGAQTIAGVKTFTAPPVFSGTSISAGSVPLAALAASTFACTAGTGLAGGGSASLGSSVAISMPAVGAAGTYAYPTQITTDAQGRVTSATPGTPPVGTGSAVTLLVMGNGAALSSWVSGQFAGLGSIAGSSASPPGAWRAPAAGTLQNWYYTSSSANPSGAGRVVTVHRAALSSGGCGAYSATAVQITMPLAGQGAFTSSPLTVTAGDCILFNQNFTLNTGSGGSTIIVAQFVPN